MKINLKGFTLMETMVTALIGSIVLTGIVSVIMISVSESDSAVSKVSSSTYSDGIHSILTETIRPAMKLKVVSSSRLEVTGDDGSLTVFEYFPEEKILKRNGKTVYIPQFAKTENKIELLTFTSGTPAEKSVRIKMEIASRTQEHDSKHGFDSQFYCRNN